MGTKQLQPSDFVHLHNHTQYSLLDGLSKVPDLIDTVKQLEMNAVAMTDHGTLSGVIEFYKTAKDQDVRPVIGIETYVAARKHTDKDPTKDKTPFHLILLAMNSKGYQNLMRLSTIAHLDGFYYRPRIDHDLLAKYNEGLIVLSACIGGEVGDALRQGQYDQAKQIAEWYKSVFGDRYYLEVQDHGHPDHPSVWPEQTNVNSQILRLGKELGIPCVVTCDAHYLKQADQEAHEILLCVQTGSFLTDEKRMSLKQFELHLTDPNEVIKRWGSDHPEVISNSSDIAERCKVEMELGKILIPKFQVPKGETEQTYLEKLVYRGLAWRYGKKSEQAAAKLTEAEAKKTISKEVAGRARYELDVIKEMGFNGYFLIIADFVNWGKNEGIVFGPGRGSAAGSIISYALKITELDPLHYDLLFERFLNPDRISMPDIDIDIQDSRRDEVIQYCVNKYGKDRVANIVTFGRMAARNAVRDVARVLQVPYADADRMAKMIPQPVQGRHIPLADSIKDSPEVRDEYQTNDQSKRVFDLAVQLEGTIRSHGVHAAGVVIAPDDIVKFVPLELAQKGVVATQYSMGPIEDLGLLKIDFLGLSNLTIIKNALRIIKRVYGKDIDTGHLPLDDAKTFELLQRGDTTGVFQFESAGMKRYLKGLEPTVFEDIVAMGALYRPGPMQWIDTFIARKHGKGETTYIHKAMEPALRNTYGVIVYQEQVMQISKDLSGFSGGQADTLRKAIGKKIPAVLAKLKDEFIDGAIKTVGADRKSMEKFWKQLEAFAAYAFPKAHAACYALISYQTAYLKANYPSAYMAALMTSDFDNTDRLTIEINECVHMGIEVLPPDVNESFVEFAVVPDTGQIRFGLSAVKNVGTGAVEEILRARSDGLFANLEDFLSRVSVRLVNRKTIESLVKSGALDNFGDRSLLMHNLDNLQAYSAHVQKQRQSGQTDLFGELSLTDGSMSHKLSLDNSGEPYPKREQLQWERELLGVYLSEHPLEQYQSALRAQAAPLESLTKSMEGKKVKIGGLVTTIREITTKNGQRMAFVQLSDGNTQIELVLFPGVYEKAGNLWKADNVLLVSGKVSTRGKDGTNGDELKIIVDDAKELSSEDAALPHSNAPNKVKDKRKSKAQEPVKQEEQANERVYIRLPNGEDQDTLMSLKQTIDSHQGETEVVLVLGDEDTKQIIKLPMRIHNNKKSLKQLHSLVGSKNVKVQ
ncbi:MAG TPA: DNA polymerase III subunit alpha [Patescibacteria group bacterium]|nr:DNA polymerase III subunit alpha [Patescibacteria group bacterium]